MFDSDKTSAVGIISRALKIRSEGKVLTDAEVEVLWLVDRVWYLESVMENVREELLTVRNILNKALAERKKLSEDDGAY